MFNDPLSLDECKFLLRSLANCALPFQCAHGRPSMIPLVYLENTSDENKIDREIDFDDSTVFFDMNDVSELTVMLSTCELVPQFPS